MFPILRHKKKKEREKSPTDCRNCRNKSKCQGWLFQNVKSGGIMNDF